MIDDQKSIIQRMYMLHRVTYGPFRLSTNVSGSSMSMMISVMKRKPTSTIQINEQSSRIRISVSALVESFDEPRTSSSSCDASSPCALLSLSDSLVKMYYSSLGRMKLATSVAVNFLSILRRARAALRRSRREMWLQAPWRKQ